MVAAIYPGTFDPVTFGHIDLVERGSRMFDRLVVAVAQNVDKRPLFDVAERVGMLKELVGGRCPNVEVDAFEGLVADQARKRGIRCILRGLRTVSDFEYEFQMALTNRDLAPDIETVFVMPSLKFSYVSSRLIRETVALGADMSHLIPKLVMDKLRARLAQGKGP
jgi:pantetheine-phosphate adenylyltransferase